MVMNPEILKSFEFGCILPGRHCLLLLSYFFREGDFVINSYNCKSITTGMWIYLKKKRDKMQVKLTYLYACK